MATLPDRAYFGDVTYPPGGRCGPRMQMSVQFVIVHSGQAEVTFGREKHLVPANHVCRVWPDVTDLFVFSPDSPTHHTWVDLYFDKPLRGLKAGLARTPFCLGLTRRMQAVLELGLAAQHAGGPPQRRMQCHLAAVFFYAYIDAAANAGGERPVPETVLKARRFIREHLADPIELAQVAEAANVTANHLVRLFHSHLHITPMRYLWQLRVQRGSDLLRGTGLSVSEVAYQVGFASPYHFSRLFSRRMGVSPRQWREKIWGKNDE
ncbi:MAG: helix-turn-helix domain-containing protein [Phycisphaerales bacterium]